MPGATIRDLFDRGTVAGLDDGQLLSRFAEGRDESAFGALVARHGPMVWATTLAVLRNEPDAEDAFQATFLILARRARTVRAGSSLAAWLHRVAHRSAVEARIAAKRRRRLETQGASIRPNQSPVEADLLNTVRTEVDRLPAPYRLAVILCDLEGLPYAEAASRVGCTEAALRNRLHRARARLKVSIERAGYSGLALPMLPTLATVPETLIRATLATALGRMTTSASVLRLVQALAKGIVMSKLKLSAALVLATSGLASLGLIAIAQNPSEKPATPVALAQSATPTPVPQKAADGRVIRGRVIDPSGQPVAEALVTLLESKAPNQADPTTRSRGDGRFEFTLPVATVGFTFGRSTIFGFVVGGTTNDIVNLTDPAQHAFVIATAPGFGVGGASRTDMGADSVAEIRLATEGPPLQGRILDESGKPVAGVKVATKGICRLIAGSDGLTRLLQGRDSDAVLSETQYLPATLAATTGADGWFSIAGVGADRIASLTLSGPTIANTDACATTRGGSTVSLESLSSRGPTLVVLPNRFDLTVKPTRILEGVVRDVESGKPLVGWAVLASPGNHLETRTDAEGRYRLAGLPLSENFAFWFDPPADQPYLEVRFRKPVGPGTDPVTIDYSAQRGVFLSGQVSDKVTGQPMMAMVATLPYPVDLRGKDRPIDEKTETADETTDPQGRYRIVVPVGKSVVAFRAFEADRYRKAQGAERLPFYDPKTREIRQVLTPILATNYHLLHEVNVEPNATDATMDIQLDPEGAIDLTILDPDDKPLEGADVQGIGDVGIAPPQRQESSKVTLMGFTPNGVRQVIVVHKGRKLAGVKVVAAADGPAQTIKLLPWGEVRGRVVAPDGTPRVNAQFGPGPQFSKKPKVQPFDVLPNLTFGKVGADAEGRFHIDALVPGMHYGASLSDQFGMVGDLFDDLTVEPGEIKDLGDVKVENTNPFYRRPKPARADGK